MWENSKDFPVPDGISREFLRSFGDFPVVLVNGELQIKYAPPYQSFSPF